MCLIGRSSAEWRITSPYLGTSQKATAPQQCHLVALTKTRESNFRLIHSIQTTKITFSFWLPDLIFHNECATYALNCQSLSCPCSVTTYPTHSPRKTNIAKRGCQQYIVAIDTCLGRNLSKDMLKWCSFQLVTGNSWKMGAEPTSGDVCLMLWSDKTANLLRLNCSSVL